MIRNLYPKYSKTGDIGPVLALRGDAMRRSSLIMERAGATEPMDLIDLNPSSSMHIALQAIEALKKRNKQVRKK